MPLARSAFVPSVALRAVVLAGLAAAAAAASPPEPAAASSATVGAAPPRIKSTAKTWTVDDILLAESADGLDIAPDGRTAVWVKAAMDAKKGARVSNLFLSRLDGEPAEIALTRGRDRHTRPRFSPDGKTIAFLSDRARPDEDEDEHEKAAHEEEEAKEEEKQKEKTQVWLVRASGGEPWPLTKLDREIADFGWKDAETLVVAAAEEKSLHEQMMKEAKDTSEVVEDAERTPPVRLFAVAVKDGKLTRLSDGSDWIEWVVVSPDGRLAAALHEQSLSFEYDHKALPVLKIHDLGSGAVRTVFEGRRVLPTGAAWTPDSKGLYVTHSYSSHPTYFTATIELLQHVDAATGAATPVDLQWKNGLGTKAVLPTTDGFLALLADGVLYRPARYLRTASGFTRQDLAGAQVPHVFDWAIGRDGRTIVYDHSTAMKPPQLWRARLDGARLADETALTTLNTGYAKKPVPRMEVVRWKGARDEEVTGLLYYPIGYHEGRRYPLFLSIHGGPAGGADMDAWSQGWDYPKLLIAQKGAFQLEVNYHGSSNFGLEWVESICCGNYYDLERVDLEKGVDAMVARGLADPDKLATMGWSNGSILTTELVTRSHRYKVASAGAGDVEWISDWAQRGLRRVLRQLLLRQGPVRGPGPLRPQVAVLPAQGRDDTDDRLHRHRRPQRAAEPELVALPRDAAGREGAGTLRPVPRRAARPAQVRPSEAQGRGGPRLVRQATSSARRPTDAAVKEGSPLAAALERKGFARAGSVLRADGEGPARAGGGRAPGPARRRASRSRARSTPRSTRRTASTPERRTGRRAGSRSRRRPPTPRGSPRSPASRGGCRRPTR